MRDTNSSQKGGKRETLEAFHAELTAQARSEQENLENEIFRDLFFSR